MKTVEERFWANVEKLGEDDCWERLGGKSGTNQAYGRIRAFGKQDYAHRVSWILHFGEIPEGLVVRHDCDNPGCVNPRHLVLGTHKDNMRDMTSRGRACKGNDHHLSKLTEAVVATIRREHANGVSKSALGWRYGVTPHTIGHIVRRITWKHVA